MSVSTYYNRSPAASILQQRGQTAVLGAGHAPTQASVSAASDEAAAAVAASTRGNAVLSAPSSLLGTSKSSRGIGRRKLRRSENARLSSNPHVVRPSARDYSLRHNDRHSSFPLPPDLQHVYAASIRGEGVAPQGESSSAAKDGPFTMSHADAHWFLAHRCGVRPCGLEAAAAASSSSNSSAFSEKDLGAVQLFVKQAEAFLAAWLTQDVFLQPAAASAEEHRDAKIDLRSMQTGASDARDLRLFEISRSPHNLVWTIPDPFMRLAVHCLARILACPSFSKDAPAVSPTRIGDVQATPQRQTWILKGRAYGVKHVPGRPGAAVAQAPSDLETPPTTDIGSELASDVAHSEVDSDPGSDWLVSDIAEDQAVDESADDDWETAIDASHLTASGEGDGDTTYDAANAPLSGRARHLIEDETGDWADAESDGG